LIQVQVMLSSFYQQARPKFQRFLPLNNQVYCFANTHKKTGLNENPEFYRLTEDGLELAANFDNSGQSAIAGDCGVIGGNAFDVYGDKFYFVTTIVDHDEIYVFDGQEVKPFFATDGIIKGFRLTGENEFFLEAAFANELLEFYLVKNGQVKKLSSYNNQALAGKYVAKVNEVEYESVEDGIQHGWVLLPKDYQAGKKYPAILDVHGGPAPLTARPSSMRCRFGLGPVTSSSSATSTGQTGRGTSTGTCGAATGQ
jgi:dipeptidyl aminopeptidase/acylaminoacyl peptidase